VIRGDISLVGSLETILQTSGFYRTSECGKRGTCGRSLVSLNSGWQFEVGESRHIGGLGAKGDWMRKVLRSGWWILMACLAVSMAFAQSAGGTALPVPVNGKTIVRFFYLPPESYWHPPLTFRVVGKNDPRLGTAPMAKPYDRTPYISLSDMQRFVAALARLHLSWKGSGRLEKPKKIAPGEMRNGMEITVFSSGGTYRAMIDPKELCETLAPLDAALREPRALWEFRLFRVNYGCRIPGFDRDAYMRHYEGR
jgi:hypothetical protein